MSYKTALIGCGRISFKHIEGYANNKDKMDLVAVCDVVEERAREKKTEYEKLMPGKDVKVYTDYKKLLAEMKPEIVTIASESGYHPDIAIDALKSGANVICEKPMALSVDDADRMNATAREQGKKLAVCFQNRFNSAVQKTYEAQKNGRFGRMLHGMIQVRWNRNESYYKQALWRGDMGTGRRNSDESVYARHRSPSVANGRGCGSGARSDAAVSETYRG